MQNERIYSAPSLSEVYKQLLIYRSTGVLTIWRAPDPRQEAARITIEQGRPLSIYWGSYREQANGAMLGWLNSWGEIHFTFLATEIRLQLPAPSSPSYQQQSASSTSAAPSDTHTHPTTARRQPAVTQPLQAMPHRQPRHTQPGQNGQQPGRAAHGSQSRVSERPLPYETGHAEENNDATSQQNPMRPETVVAALTQNGKSFSSASLPRYERTIFLLINGKRTLANLSQLTKRPLEEVYSTLLRLRNMLLITIEEQPAKKRDK